MDQLIRIPKAQIWTGRVVSGLVVLFMIADAVPKIIKIAPIMEVTRQLGLPDETIAGIGVLLLVITALYALPWTAVLGAILMTGYLGGAIAIHVRAQSGLFPAVFSTLFGGAGLGWPDPARTSLAPDDLASPVTQFPWAGSYETSGDHQMLVKRIVANIKTANPAQGDGFYQRIFGLELVMDHGWIRTYAGNQSATVQISLATEGGSGTAVPDLSIEVDDLNEVLDRLRAAQIPIEYGPVTEPWGVRRCFVRDPFGKCVNVLQHD